MHESAEQLQFHERKIAMVIADLGSGGAQRVLSHLANAFIAKHAKVTVISLAPQHAGFFPLHPDISVAYLPAITSAPGILRRIRSNITRLVNLRRVLQATDCKDIISFIHTTNVLTILAAFGLGKRVTISERNDFVRQKIPVTWQCLRWLTYPFAATLTANSRATARTLKFYFPFRKIRYIPNPVSSLSSSADVPNMQLKSPYILSVGRLHPQKGFDVLIKAFAILAPNFPSWHLAIVGAGPLATTLQNLIDQLGLTNRVILLGEQKNLGPIYRNAKIYVQSSVYEGTPNALLEAMSFNLAPIISDNICTNTWVIAEHSGLRFETNDCKALASQIRRLIENDELRIRLGNGAAAAVKNLHVNNILREWQEVLTPLPLDCSHSNPPPKDLPCVES